MPAVTRRQASTLATEATMTNPNNDDFEAAKKNPKSKKKRNESPSNSEAESPMKKVKFRKKIASVVPSVEGGEKDPEPEASESEKDDTGTGVEVEEGEKCEEDIEESEEVEEEDNDEEKISDGESESPKELEEVAKSGLVPVSVSEESSGDSKHGDSDTELSEYDEDTVPLKPVKMYFKRSSYTTKVKVGTRCGINEFFETLDKLKPKLTSTERGWFEEHPQFKHFFHMPNYGNHKVQGMWMCLLRTAEIEKKKEVWFIVNGVPIRYGLREHALISGLNCKNYPVGYKDRGDLEFVNRHFEMGEKGSKVRVKDVRAKLLKMGDHKERLNMIVLYFLGSIICAQKKVGEGAPDVFDVFKKAVGDLDYCKTFPWGRLSYDYMVEAIIHTGEHYKKQSRDLFHDEQWAVQGFCLPLEMLAFECIWDLRKKFREDVPGAEKMCPRMCKSKFKKGVFKGFPIDDINKALGTTTDIDSIMGIHDVEENNLLAEIWEKDDDDDVYDVMVESWSKRLRHGYMVLFEDILEEDIAARANKADKVPKPLPRRKRNKTPVPPTEYAELLNTVKSLEERVNVSDERLAVVEAELKDLKAKSNE